MEPYQRFHLSDQPGGCWPHCGKDGLDLGGIPLLRQTHGRFQPRSSCEIGELLSAAYGLNVDVEPLMVGLQTVANALNDGLLAKAMVATVLLKLPALDRQHDRRTAETDIASQHYLNEPRDWHGRWTDEGDTTASPSPAAPDDTIHPVGRYGAIKSLPDRSLLTMASDGEESPAERIEEEAKRERQRERALAEGRGWEVNPPETEPIQIIPLVGPGPIGRPAPSTRPNARPPSPGKTSPANRATPGGKTSSEAEATPEEAAEKPSTITQNAKIGNAFERYVRAVEGLIKNTARFTQLGSYTIPDALKNDIINEIKFARYIYARLQIRRQIAEIKAQRLKEGDDSIKGIMHAPDFAKVSKSVEDFFKIKYHNTEEFLRFFTKDAEK
jgi:hypothetical protein